MGRHPTQNIEIHKLDSINKLKNLINNKIICVIARGASVQILEDRIEEFKNYDIIWASMNLFTPAEFILNKIGKSLNLVSDCSTIDRPDYYETPIRIPRFKTFLEKDNNLLFISQLVISECFKRDNNWKLFQKYINKIATIDDIFDIPEAPKEIWDAPPNSITLLFAACIAGKASKIICFGYDGLKGNSSVERTFLDRHCIQTYYKADKEAKDRKAGTGKIEIGSLATDSFFFERDFPKIEKLYKGTYNNLNCEIVNCSPTTMFTVIRKTDYDNVHKEFV